MGLQSDASYIAKGTMRPQFYAVGLLRVPHLILWRYLVHSAGSACRTAAFEWVTQVSAYVPSSFIFKFCAIDSISRRCHRWKALVLLISVINLISAFPYRT